MIVVEVLFPSTRRNDLTRKLVGYFQVHSVQHYLIFWADQQRVIHHRRRNESGEIDTRIVTSGEIRLDPPSRRSRWRTFTPINLVPRRSIWRVHASRQGSRPTGPGCERPCRDPRSGTGNTSRRPVLSD